MKTVNEYTFAYWTPRLTIGSEINDGFTEEQAVMRYQNWLKADKQNPIFGRYRVTQDLEVVEIKRRRKKRR